MPLSAGWNTTFTCSFIRNFLFLVLACLFIRVTKMLHLQMALLQDSSFRFPGYFGSGFYTHHHLFLTAPLIMLDSCPRDANITSQAAAKSRIPHQNIARRFPNVSLGKKTDESLAKSCVCRSSCLIRCSRSLSLTVVQKMTRHRILPLLR